ncbi:FmdB family zinc ribbon protein [Pedococcus sp. 5OH_020]|uniref:FmdB family zinc ribbon protein n=1 Tax=Pedococcus sp. 5OH_020 TaxID=2989814 RepID=UPI0022E9CE9C|nr:FmdB family zinc ribbon protein [Pedococcus sp. 5OH_020]
MPTYSYACTECQHRFDAVQSFSDDSLTVCPECNGRLRKVFNAVGVVFKGGGFYRTDSRSEASAGSSGSASAGKESSSNGSSSESSTSTSESSTSAATTKSGGSKTAAPAKAATGGSAA